jgi:prophage DNA circulation protein
MATIQEIAPAPWRMALLPASFGGAVFHVEQQGRSGGRRVVLHEYPKRNNPYAEDMGRSAVRYQMTGYIVGPSYNVGKRALMSVLDNSEGAMLVDPYLATPKKCICERYSVSETRERGGYCTFEMSFVELGSPGNTPVQENTDSTVANNSNASASAAEADMNNAAAQGAQITADPYATP